MTGWEVFQAEAPELAAFVRERLDLRVSYLATLRPDGAPRVNPVTPWFAEGRLFIRMYPGSGEALLFGTAAVVEDPQPAVDVRPCVRQDTPVSPVRAAIGWRAGCRRLRERVAGPRRHE